jgi:hypothetical protein
VCELVDRDAIVSGAAASGTPWQHFDLGHGYCTYNYFEQCPHRYWRINTVGLKRSSSFWLA